MSERRKQSLWTAISWIQGGYYVATGLWPLVSIRSFQAVTGRKFDNFETGLEIDHWQVMTIGLLITAIGITLLVAAYRQTQSPELALLAISAATALAAIDIVYTLRSVLLPIYLLDAAIELLLIGGWVITLVVRGRQH